jgi:hypothetical protein
MWGVWREDRSAFYKCSWSSPAQWFSGPSPVGLVTIFYYLRFETSLFVASYDSQGYGGGIRPRLHMGVLLDCRMNCLLQLDADRKQNTPLNGSSVVLCVSVVTGTCVHSGATKPVVSEMCLPLPSNGPFRLSGFDTLVVKQTCVNSAASRCPAIDVYYC